MTTLEADAPIREDPLTFDAGLARARACYYAGDLDTAERVCRELLKQQPNHPRLFYRLGMIAIRVGTPTLAAAFLSRAVAGDPTVPSFHRALGDALRLVGQLPAAETSLRRAQSLAPLDPRILVSLSELMSSQGRLREALDTMRQAVELAPQEAPLHMNLGVILARLGHSEDAVACFRTAHLLAPDFAAAHAGVLFTQHYVPTEDLASLFAEAKAWGQRHAESFTRLAPPHRNDPDPGRRLRIGYVSPDFHQHPVGRIMQAVLPSHDAAQVELFCYANSRAIDSVAARLCEAAHHWRSLVHLGDAAAADLIRSDRIDILIDLSGHTANNRLLALARRPAPVQAVWLGYFDTTGMTSIDYILADRVVCPPGDDQYYVERVVRLPSSFLCYAPPSPSPDVSPPPVLSSGHVTFGCFNNIAKITPDVISVWAEILRAIPDSRLCLKYFGFDDPLVTARYSHLFDEHGVSPGRLTLLGSTPLEEHLAAFAQVDVALDPFPYNGGMTTLDSLWMGVPVVSLNGNRFVGRMGASALTTIGLDELIAGSRDEYVRKAIALAHDPHRLAALRSGLRQRMLDSPLADATVFTRDLEAAYRDIWQRWCSPQPSS